MGGRRLRRIGKRVLAAAIAVACLWAIAGALEGQTPATLWEALRKVPLVSLGVALGLVATNFLLMSGIEYLALRDAEVKLPPGRIVVSAFVGNALSIAVGLGPISGAGVRAGLYRRWGLPVEAAAITAVSVTLISLTGGATLAAIGLIAQPDVIARAFGLPHEILRACGVGFFVALFGLMAIAGRRRTKFTLWRVQVSAPSAGGVLARALLGATDWLISANIFFVFLSFAHEAAPLSFVTAFATAHFAGMAAGSPAGLGVFDALMLHVVTREWKPEQIAAGLLLYRLIAYATPALLALIPYLLLSEREEKAGEAISP